MGYSENRWKIQNTSQKEAVENQKNKGLGETTMEEEKGKEQEEGQEQLTGTVEEEKTEEMPEEKAEEEAKPPPREEKPEEIVEERIYTIPLGKAWIGSPRKRAPRAMRIIKSFLVKHMKLEKREEGGEEEEPKRLIINNEVNEKVWSRGIEKPPRKIRVRAAKDKEGNVTVYLAEGE